MSEAKINLTLLGLIIDPKKTPKAEEALKQAGIYVHYNVLAKGTAGREMIDYLGLDGTEKNLLLCMIEKNKAKAVLQALNDSLHFEKAGRGIAFTLPLDGVTGSAAKLLTPACLLNRAVNNSPARKPTDDQNTNERIEMTNTDKHEMILAVANQGYGEEVMITAKDAGAFGGTIIMARQQNSEQAIAFFGISVQAKKEIVAMIIPKASKQAVMQAIVDKHGGKNEAHAIILSVPVDDVLGLA